MGVSDSLHMSVGPCLPGGCGCPCVHGLSVKAGCEWGSVSPGSCDWCVILVINHTTPLLGMALTNSTLGLSEQEVGASAPAGARIRFARGFPREPQGGQPALSQAKGCLAKGLQVSPGAWG